MARLTLHHVLHLRIYADIPNPQAKADSSEIPWEGLEDAEELPNSHSAQVAQR